MGGTRTVPAPDPIARDYLLLALRLDQHIPGLVDGYFGPAVAQGRRSTWSSSARRAALRDDAAALRERLAAEVAEPDRRTWLDAQLVALETQAAALAGEPLPYLEPRRRAASGSRRPRRDDARSPPPGPRIDALLPGDAPLDGSPRGLGRGLEIPVERLPDVIDWLVERFRAAPPTPSGCPTARTCGSRS